MLGLFQREKPCVGVVRFRGNIHPRAEEFEHLQQRGIEVRRVEPTLNEHWHLKLKHPRWGKAEVIAPRNAPAFPTEILAASRNLSKEERKAAESGGVELMLAVESRTKHLLRDRKNLLHYMSTLMGAEGVLAFDSACNGCWPRRRLDEELAHDADLDISAIFEMHGVTPDGWKPGKGEDESAAPVNWLHTHGLAELGAFDVDILKPHASVCDGRGFDAIRSVAFAIVEGEIKPDTPHWPFVGPRVNVRFVPTTEFHRTASAEHQTLRDQDEHHTENRSVLCEPLPSKVAFWRSSSPEPARGLMRELPEQGIMHFSKHATEMMARRARGTIHLFRALMDEFREFELPAIAKMGYHTDTVGQDSCEHLWFSVHAVTDAGLDATLDSKPFDIKNLVPGKREVRPLERLTDWAIVTPLGMITPRNLLPAEAMRVMGPLMKVMMSGAKA